MKTCKWSIGEEEGYLGLEETEYLTSCGNEFILMSGAPSENGFKYCPYCGGSLVEEEE